MGLPLRNRPSGSKPNTLKMRSTERAGTVTRVLPARFGSDRLLTALDEVPLENESHVIVSIF